MSFAYEHTAESQLQKQSWQEFTTHCLGKSPSGTESQTRSHCSQKTLLVNKTETLFHQ